MAEEKFDPAPHDKYAEDPKRKPAARDDRLSDGLKDTFPASDPPSHTQPSKADKAR